MSIESKKQSLKNKILEDFKGEKRKCVKIFKLMDDMHDANIPMGYWFLKMKEFKGSPMLKDLVDAYIENIKDRYYQGVSVCFAGNQGTGKTMSAVCIAKAALKLDMTAYYTTASDMLADITNPETKHASRFKIRDVDFLILDELDSRFFPSGAQKELFSGIYENIFRYRAHNTLPTIICTNETDNLLNVFLGAGVQSIKSLHDQYLKIYPVVGKDYRKQIGETNELGQ